MELNRIERIFVRAVEEQLARREPATIQQHLDRLMAAGFTREETLTMMAGLTAQLTQASLITDEPFDLKKYEQLLAKLPALPTE